MRVIVLRTVRLGQMNIMENCHLKMLSENLCSEPYPSHSSSKTGVLSVFGNNLIMTFSRGHAALQSTFDFLCLISC